jgi:hypothetical protein
MSKTPSLIVELVSEEDYEDYKYEYSAALALDFIKEELLTRLDQFENANDDDKYIYGVATLGLFNEIIARLGEMGYTEKELKKEVKTWLNTSIGQTLH